MDNRSRGNRTLPKGFPVQGDSNLLAGKNIMRTHDVRVPANITNNWLKAVVLPSAKIHYFVGKAYSETAGTTDLMEDLLLQRDYIID